MTFDATLIVSHVLFFEFIVLSAILIHAKLFQSFKLSLKETPAYELKYYLVFCLASLADWLPGSYLYVVLSKLHGFKPLYVRKLFAVGFLASLIAGLFLGYVADKFGRKKSCLLYALLYSIYGIIIRFRSLSALARVLSGMAGSLLYTVFESWLVDEHEANCMPIETLDKIFSKAYFIQSVMGILSALCNHLVVDREFDKRSGESRYLRPFSASVDIFKSQELFCITVFLSQLFPIAVLTQTRIENN